MSRTLPTGIRERKGSFLVDVTVGGERRTATCRTLAEAVVKRQELKKAIKSGEPKNKKPWTLQRSCDECMADWKHSRSLKTARMHAEHILRHFGASTPVEEITKPLIDAWIATLRSDNYKENTIRLKLAYLSKMLRIAHVNGALTKVPIIKRPKEKMTRTRFILPDEEQKLVNALLVNEWIVEARCVIILLDTGMRVSELYRVARQDVSSGHLHIWQTKNDQPRTIPLTPRAEQALQEVLGVIPHPRVFRYRFGRACEIADLSGVTIHTLRHTCASRLVQRTGDLLMASKWLGHSDLSTTRRYAHLATDHLTKGRAALMEAF